MNADPNEFEKLRRLLALKRHEQPPPGYFDRLPMQILRRIGAEQAVKELSWWNRLTAWFESRPAYAGAFAMVACAMLVLGIQSARRTIRDEAPAYAAPEKSAVQPGTEMETASLPVATNIPGTAAPPFLFDPNGLRVERASFPATNR